MLDQESEDLTPSLTDGSSHDGVTNTPGLRPCICKLVVMMLTAKEGCEFMNGSSASVVLSTLHGAAAVSGSARCWGCSGERHGRGPP